jgi:hypothetical protein
MRKTLVFTTVTIAALVAARWQARAPISFVAAEQIRLRAHFDSVERELRARDVPGLTPAQRAARTRLLDILHRYQVRGVFPQNIDVPDRDVPVFIDWRGTRCGFAYLIEQTGHEDLVQRIAATRNNALAADLKDDSEVAHWLVENGVSLAEATRIQPTYGCGDHYGGDCAAAVIPSTIASPAYKAASGVAIASNAATFTLSVLDDQLPRRTKGIAGVASGVLGLALGAPSAGNGGERGTFARWDAGVGAVSLVVGIVQLAKHTEPAAQSRASVGPWFRARGSSGLAARVTF